MPLRQDNLFEPHRQFSGAALAGCRAIRGKRRKPAAAAFFADLEGELLALERQLQDRRISAGPLRRV